MTMRHRTWPGPAWQALCVTLLSEVLRVLLVCFAATRCAFLYTLFFTTCLCFVMGACYCKREMVTSDCWKSKPRQPACVVVFRYQKDVAGRQPVRMFVFLQPIISGIWDAYLQVENWDWMWKWLGHLWWWRKKGRKMDGRAGALT